MTNLLIGMFIGLLLATILVIGAVVTMSLLQHYVNIVLERSRRNDRRRLDRNKERKQVFEQHMVDTLYDLYNHLEASLYISG